MTSYHQDTEYFHQPSPASSYPEDTYQESHIGGKQMNYQPMQSYNPHGYIPNSNDYNLIPHDVSSTTLCNGSQSGLTPPAHHAAAAAIVNSGHGSLTRMSLQRADSNHSFDSSASHQNYRNDFHNHAPTIEDDNSNKSSKRERARGHTPRPSNSFILYRREKHVEIMAQYKGGKTLNNNVISKIVASMWKQESAETKARFASLAEQEKKAHMLKYPDYKYRPRKSTSKKATTKKAVSTPPKEVQANNHQHHQHHQQPMVQSHMYGNVMVAPPYPVMNQPLQWNMVPTQMTAMGSSLYQPLHVIEQTHRMPMVETEIDRNTYDLMNSDQFDMTPTYDGLHGFHQEGLLINNEFPHAWSMNSSIHGWDLGGLEQIPE